jgi:predicted O-methyltransferase YrrM
MSDTTLNLTPKVYDYLQQVSLREPEVLQELRAQTHKMSMGQMQISPEQGQFMRLLVELINAKKTLEIGVFTGYSALSVALSLPSDGKVIGCDTNVEWTKIARRYWEKAGVADKIDLRLAPALETLQGLLDEGHANTFDFAFIALLRTGGLVAIDNVLWDGDVADLTVTDANTTVLRELNAKLHLDQRVTLSMLPIGDGLTLARKR